MRDNRRRYNSKDNRDHRDKGRNTRHLETSSTLVVSKRNLDINCDLGQGFGIYQNQFEEKIIPYITSVNIACGAHAGDPMTISRAIDLAKKHNVSIGALIGYQNIYGNGQNEMYLDVDELRALVLYQLGALYGLLHSKGLEIRHVRTHGFLYRQLYTDLLIAETVAKAITEFSKWVVLVGLSGPILQTACTNANIKMGQEVQINRRYRRDGSILPYSPIIDRKNMLEESAKRAREVIQAGNITCEDKSKLKVNVDTIHLPSDTEESIELARTVRSMIVDPKPILLDKYDKYFADAVSLK